MTVKNFIICLSILLILFLSFQAWKFFGKPYLKLSLIGKEFISDADELYAFNDGLEKPYLLAKKYKYSKDVLSIGFGGSSTRRDDFYSLGVYTHDKMELIPIKYEYIQTVENYKTKALYLACIPFYIKGDEATVYYKIENNRAVQVDSSAIIF
jgi:hypothetical protein